MKNLQCKVEGTWKQVMPYQLTPEEDAILKSSGTIITKDTPKEVAQANVAAKKALIAEIETKRFVAPMQEDADLCQSIYEKNKPKLGNNDKYELLSCNVELPAKTGTLLYRINSKTDLVRF